MKEYNDIDKEIKGSGFNFKFDGSLNKKPKKSSLY